MEASVQRTADSGETLTEAWGDGPGTANTMALVGYRFRWPAGTTTADDCSRMGRVRGVIGLFASVSSQASESSSLARFLAAFLSDSGKGSTLHAPPPPPWGGRGRRWGPLILIRPDLIPPPVQGSQEQEQETGTCSTLVPDNETRSSTSDWRGATRRAHRSLRATNMPVLDIPHTTPRGETCRRPLPAGD